MCIHLQINEETIPCSAKVKMMYFSVAFSSKTQRFFTDTLTRSCVALDKCCEAAHRLNQSI